MKATQLFFCALLTTPACSSLLKFEPMDSDSEEEEESDALTDPMQDDATDTTEIDGETPEVPDTDALTDGSEEEAPPGCWTDPASGLMWQVTPPEGYMNWQAAMDYCDGLDLCGHGDWHLPTISELRSIIRGCPATETDGACGVTDECVERTCQGDECDGCAEGNGSSGGCYSDASLPGECSWYWSSSISNPDIWFVGFNPARVWNTSKDSNLYVRCARE